jgi:hypothetical protein
MLNPIHSVNGCSLKTSENLIAALSILPQWIMFETGESISTGLYI